MADTGSMQDMPKGSGEHYVNWMELPCKDRAQAEAFFGKLFDWKFQDWGDGYFVFLTPNGQSGGFNSQLDEGLNSLLYIYVPDIDAHMKKIKAAGGEQVSEKMVVDQETNGGVAHFKDAAGMKWGVSDIPVEMTYRPMPFGGGEKPEPNSICSYELYGGDLNKTEGFYSSVFGWGLRETMPNFMAADPGKGVSGVFQGHTPQCNVMLYIWAEHVGEKIKEIEAAGGARLGNPMSMAGFATFGYFKDPSGTFSIGLIGPENTAATGEENSETGSNAMAHEFDWLEFRSADNEAMQKFYSEVFGWQFMPFGEDMVVTMPGGMDKPGASFRGNCPEGTPQTVAFIKTADIDESMQKVKDAGCTIEVDKQELPQVGWIAFFKDPSGNIVGLHQPPAM